MSALPTLKAVMQMLSVITLMDLILAHAKLDTLEMAKVVLVSSLLETKNYKFSCGLKNILTHKHNSLAALQIDIPIS